MFNAPRVAITVVVLALVGGLAYMAAPTVERANVPAGPAAIDAAGFSGFTGESFAGGGRPGETSEHEWGSVTLGEYYTRGTVEVDDPRLTGPSRSIHNQHRYRGGMPYGVRTVALEIVNDDGAWNGQGIGLQKPSDTTMHYEFALSGSGDYEGLSALLTLSQDTWGFRFDADGVIFPGELPPYPVLERTAAAAATTTQVDPRDYAGFTGQIVVGGGQGTGDATLGDFGVQVRDVTFWDMAVESTDPRIAGLQESLVNYDSFGFEGYGRVHTSADRIVNDDGAWAGTARGYVHPETGNQYFGDLLTGSGSYEGLSAIRLALTDGMGSTFQTDGVIFPGELPPYPELPPRE